MHIQLKITFVVPCTQEYNFICCISHVNEYTRPWKWSFFCLVRQSSDIPITSKNILRFALRWADSMQAKITVWASLASNLRLIIFTSQPWISSRSHESHPAMSYRILWWVDYTCLLGSYICVQTAFMFVSMSFTFLAHFSSLQPHVNFRWGYNLYDFSCCLTSLNVYKLFESS